MRRLALPLALALGATAASAAPAPIVLDRLAPYELRAQGFELSRKTKARIESTVYWNPSFFSFFERDSGQDDLGVRAWLLEAGSRRRVWQVELVETEELAPNLRSSDETIELEPGRYELYVYSGLAGPHEVQRDETSPRPWWQAIFTGERAGSSSTKADLERCHVTLSWPDLPPDAVRRFEVVGDRADALVRHNRMGDSLFMISRFELSRPSRVRVYHLFERTADDNTPADYGVILDSTTRAVVWEPRLNQETPAGGGEKNRAIEQEIELAPGRYEVATGTDDSHSFGGFNAIPPYDPFNWGLTLLPGTGFDPSSFRLLPALSFAKPLVSFAAVGDDELLEQPFRLRRAGKLWVRALGEAWSQDGFADLAWIVGADSRRSVWRMERKNTRGAGGAPKNRLFDGLVELPAGDYVLFFATDGSHSHAGWNTAAPFEPNAWGVTVHAGPGLAAEDFELLAEAPDDSLVRIARAGDGARLERRFALDRATRVRVHAVGEGKANTMVDYGYIVAEPTGNVVWTMKYERTEHAGGAKRNRVADEELSLEPGKYKAIYVSDGAHSFGNWDAPLPSDPPSWGISIRPVR